MPNRTHPHCATIHPLHICGRFVIAITILLSVAAQPRAYAIGLTRVRFVVVDAKTHRPIAGARVVIEDPGGGRQAMKLLTSLMLPAPTSDVDLQAWCMSPPNATAAATVITIPEGISVTLQTQSAQPPVKDIYVKITATRIAKNVETSGGATLSHDQLEHRTSTAPGGGSSNLVNSSTTTGAAADSGGQVHVRGEHAEIAYVIDGVPLPDSLSGRVGVVVVPATVQTLDILTGGYAPEFGGQTAAILNVTTLPGVDKAHSEYSLSGGSNDTLSGEYTALGPIGKKASYVLNFDASRTDLALEPLQPKNQTAHNSGSDIDMFAKLNYAPSSKDAVSLTLSRSLLTQGRSAIRTQDFSPPHSPRPGEGYGFLEGIRNADGSIPIQINPGGLGSAPMVLASQETDGMDITQREINEFATLLWKRKFDKDDVGLLSFTLMHSGQDIHNDNPGVNLLNLPVDNSIEYNPTATRNVHHVQIAGSEASKRGAHHLKVGFLLDDQNGTETYQIIPASQLALDELAALDAKLVPIGADVNNAQGGRELDVNGNPVFMPTSGTSPVVTIHRSGFYRAAYAQDSWTVSKRFSFNYGLRGDWYKQSESVGQATVDTIYLSPRLNFQYDLDKLSILRWSYNRLFNTPPIAQGASIGSPIVPEVLDQYDISLEHELAPRQKAKLAYYVKQMHNQVDTGLLVPGSEIGLYSAVNFQIGAVHGIEFAYDLEPKKDPKTHKPCGWDAFL